MRHIYILGLYIERRSAVHVLWRTVLAASEGSLFLCTHEESPGERALVALSPTLESLKLVCTAIRPSKPIIPLLLGAGAQSFPSL